MTRPVVDLTPDQLARWKKGSALLAAGRAESAAPLLAALAAELPGHALIGGQWAQCLLALGRPEEALERTGRALAREPESLVPWLVRIRALRSLGRHAEALDAARETVRVAPDRYGAHLEHALCLLKVPGGAGQARQAAAEAVRLAPELPGTHVAAGLVARRAGHPEEAAAAYREALRLDPQCAAGRNGLAELQLAAGQVAEAIQGFAGALAVDPLHPLARHNIRSATVRLAVSARWYALGCLVLGCLPGRLAGDSTAVRAALLGAQALLVCVWALRTLRPLPRPALGPVLRLVPRCLPAASAVSGVLLCLLCGAAAAGLPLGGAADDWLWGVGAFGQSAGLLAAARLQRARRRRLAAEGRP